MDLTPLKIDCQERCVGEIMTQPDMVRQMVMAESEKSPVIWIINRQRWPRVYLVAELKERGFGLMGYEDLAQSLQELQQPDVEKPRVIVLDLRGQPLTREALIELKRTAIPVMILGNAAELNEKLIREFDWAAVMKPPFSIGEAADRVEKLVRRTTGFEK